MAQYSLDCGVKAKYPADGNVLQEQHPQSFAVPRPRSSHRMAGRDESMNGKVHTKRYVVRARWMERHLFVASLECPRGTRSIDGDRTVWQLI